MDMESSPPPCSGNWRLATLLSGYVTLGLLGSHFLQVQVYSIRGSKTLQTWLGHAGIDAHIPIGYGIYLSLVTITVLSIATFGLALRGMNESPSATLKWGLRVVLAMALVSQLPFSSVMRLPYEALFLLVAMFGIITRALFDPIRKPTEAVFADAKGIIKFVLPISIGLPLLVGGVGFISSFYSGDQDIVRLQLYRHFYLSAYFLLGAGFFVIYPMLYQMLRFKSGD